MTNIFLTYGLNALTTPTQSSTCMVEYLHWSIKRHALWAMAGEGNQGICHWQVLSISHAQALELLKPPVPQNAANRVRAHIRRGTAFCELQMYAEGMCKLCWIVTIVSQGLRTGSESVGFPCKLQMYAEGVCMMPELIERSVEGQEFEPRLSQTYGSTHKM